MTADELQDKTGAPRSHQRTWDENGLFPLLSAGSTAMVGTSPHRFRPTYARANVGHPSYPVTVSCQAGTVEPC
jgi:hypothetical protein